jgi:hypothetical protein
MCPGDTRVSEAELRDRMLKEEARDRKKKEKDQDRAARYGRA